MIIVNQHIYKDTFLLTNNENLTNKYYDKLREAYTEYLKRYDEGFKLNLSIIEYTFSRCSTRPEVFTKDEYKTKIEDDLHNIDVRIWDEMLSFINESCFNII